MLIHLQTMTPWPTDEPFEDEQGEYKDVLRLKLKGGGKTFVEKEPEKRETIKLSSTVMALNSYKWDYNSYDWGYISL